MKNKDIVEGMKVVPFQKTEGRKKLENSEVWKCAREKHQPFLFVGYSTRKNVWALSDEEKDYGFDYFNARDFEPYIEGVTGDKA